MLARLLLVLLLAAFSMPAAACHDAAVPAQHTMPMGGEHHPAPDAPAPAHACVGCVPPSDMVPARVTPPVAPSAAVPAATVASLDLRAAPAPALPPPRRG